MDRYVFPDGDLASLDMIIAESQFAALEEPSPDEEAWVCDIRRSPQEIVAGLVARAST